MPTEKEIKICENCEFLKELLEKEREERKYYIDLLLCNTKTIEKANDNEEFLDKLPSIHKFVTLSAIRREAEQKSREKAVVIAKKEDLTEGERKFQEELSKISDKVS